MDNETTKSTPVSSTVSEHIRFCHGPTLVLLMFHQIRLPLFFSSIRWKPHSFSSNIYLKIIFFPQFHLSLILDQPLYFFPGLLLITFFTPTPIAPFQPCFILKLSVSESPPSIDRIYLQTTWRVVFLNLSSKVTKQKQNKNTRKEVKATYCWQSNGVQTMHWHNQCSVTDWWMMVIHSIIYSHFFTQSTILCAHI